MANCGACGALCTGQCGGRQCSCAAPKTACTVPYTGTSQSVGLGAGVQGKSLTYCADLSSDPQNCGGCGLACGSGACQNFACAACNAPLAICPAGGGAVVCTDLTSDSQNCGFCGNVCQSTQHCAQSACVCDDSTPDYCALGGTYCTSVASDPNNCGRCGNVCMPGAGCSEGSCKCDVPGANPQNCSCAECDKNQICALAGGLRCVDCQPYETVCNNSCKDLSQDLNNCGKCAVVCGKNQVCSNGACMNCPAGQSVCFNRCRDLQTDRLNCGSCVNVCGGNEVCQMGVCVADGADAGAGETSSAGGTSGAGTSTSGGFGAGTSSAGGADSGT
jgi:hypothetical protein